MRSACQFANNDRDGLYYQQQLYLLRVSADKLSAHLSRTRFRGKETKGCTDCHVSRANDNNAWMAQCSSKVRTS